MCHRHVRTHVRQKSFPIHVGGREQKEKQEHKNNRGGVAAYYIEMQVTHMHIYMHIYTALYTELHYTHTHAYTRMCVCVYIYIDTQT